MATSPALVPASPASKPAHARLLGRSAPSRGRSVLHLHGRAGRLLGHADVRRGCANLRHRRAGRLLGHADLRRGRARCLRGRDAISRSRAILPRSRAALPRSRAALRLHGCAALDLGLGEGNGLYVRDSRRVDQVTNCRGGLHFLFFSDRALWSFCVASVGQLTMFPHRSDGSVK